MEGTLYSKLRALHVIEEKSKEWTISRIEKELKDAENRFLGEFYKEDPLAYEVAKGNESYMKKIIPIEEKYSSFWKRITIPKEDKPFDDYVMKVIDSINNVGVRYVPPESYTTEGRRRKIWEFDQMSIILGGIIGFSTLVIPYLVFKNINKIADINILIRGGIPIITASLPYIMLKPVNYVIIKDKLNDLRNAAHSTDEFLKALHIKEKNYII